MTESHYQKRREGEWTIFDVTPAEEPKFWFIVIGGALVGLLMFWLILPIFFAAWAIWKGLTWKLRPALHQSPSSFRVSSDQIEAAGRSFRADDIHQLIVRNALAPSWLPSDVQILVSGGFVAGVIHRRRCAEIAFSLDVDTGGKAYSLAGGMDLTTANGLLHDVTRALGSSESVSQSYRR